ncbi:hypothetical protein ACF1HU_35885 [Streptomyces olivaceus]|uniref:hypothetical protein n=1 Tax=Streptomyces olivaceus TaxID=47716 RepID=UPI0036FF5D65
MTGTALATVRLVGTSAGAAAPGTPAAVRRELAKVNSTMDAHPHLPAFGAVDFADVPGRGSVVMVALPDPAAVRAWSRTVGAVAEWSGRTHYGRTEPSPASTTVHDWLWWAVKYADATVNGVPVRLWTLETSGHPRVVDLALAARIPGGAT